MTQQKETWEYLLSKARQFQEECDIPMPETEFIASRNYIKQQAIKEFMGSIQRDFEKYIQVKEKLESAFENKN